ESEAVRLMDVLAVPVLELRDFSASRGDWPSKPGLYANFRRELDPTVERNLKAIPRKQRAMVRKGIRHELRSEIDDGIDRLYRVYAESVLNLGTLVFANSSFRILKDEFSTSFDIVTISCGGIAVASLVYFFFRHVIL